MTADRHDAAVEWARTIIEVPQLTAEVAWGSDDATTYRLRDDGSVRAYLKIGGGELAGERDRLLWLRGRVAVPHVLGFAAGQEQQGWLLTAPLRGADLSRPEHRTHPHRLVRLLASALTQLHSLDPADCPFADAGAGSVVIHGDACLPNFVFDETNFTGYLDVGGLGLGDSEVDLAAAVWSLDYNLGAGFGAEFLRAYGWPEEDEATVERFRSSYEAA